MNVHINDTNVRMSTPTPDIKVNIANNVIAATVTANDLALPCGNDDVSVVIKPPIVRQNSGDIYDGEYSVTPSSSEITLRTSGKTLTRDVVVNPIPSNYGLITWNGSFLTVS